MAFISDYPNKRTYDAERRVEFECVGRDRDGYEEYEMIWNGQRLKIGTNFHASLDENHMLNILRKILFIKLPPAFERKRAEVKSMVREAFMAYGINHNLGRVASINLEFSDEEIEV